MSFSSWLPGWHRHLVRTRKANHARRKHKPRTFRPGLHELEKRLTPSVSFLAVGAGDATSSDAILWTRAQDSTTAQGVPLMAQVSTDQTFATGLAKFAGTTDPAHDYTIHLDATGLASGTRYFYRFVAPDNTVSPVGTFETAPDPTAKAAVHLGFTGDADGLMRPYDATSSANFTPPGAPGFGPQNFDYFVWLGDTIYETASGQGTPNSSPAVANTNPPNIADYWAKYRQQFLPVSTGPYAGLTNFFDSTGHYTLLDNHELGNKQFINGGAPQGNPAGAGADATNPANDVNTTGSYMNQTVGFQRLVQAYTDYQPIRVQTVNAPNDPRSNGTQQLYFSQQWGANSIFFNLDDRTDRDIRLKTASGADDTGVRADNPGRTMLGKTQLNWFEQGLLAAQAQGVTWKFVAVSSPIDQIGAIGSGADGGKSWMGGYRAERNALLKFIADHHIDHVVFLSTDDHQLRVNELGYFTQLDANGTPVQSSYTRVPGAFEVVSGPIGATGPDTITDHSFANIKSLADGLAAQETAAGVDPIGLDPSFPGLKNVSREGDTTADTSPKPFDFYSPDTFNYARLDVSADGSTLTVTVDGINSYATNSFPQPATANPVRQILQFQIGLEPVKVAVSPATAPADGTTTLSATLTDASTGAPLAGRTLAFSLNGHVVGSAQTDSHGTATLGGVSVEGVLPGVSAGAVTVHFAGDAADQAGDGSGSLEVLPVTDVTSQVKVQRRGSTSNHKDPAAVTLTVTSPERAPGPHATTSPTLTGIFVIELTNLTPGVTLTSASVTAGGVTTPLTVTHNSAGDPLINVPQSLASSLAAGESLPDIDLTFSNPNHARFDFDTAVFLDPLEVDPAALAAFQQNIDHVVVIYQENWSFDALYGLFPGANGLGNPPSSTPNVAQVSKSGAPITLTPSPLNGGPDPNFPSDGQGHLAFPGTTTPVPVGPYDLTQFIQPGQKTGDIVHRYWQEQYQIDGGKMDRFMAWSDNPGLVESRFDATNLPEGLLAQQYSLDDNFFHAAYGGSFLNHQFLIAAQAPVYPNAPTGMTPLLDANGVLQLNSSGNIIRDGNITPIGAPSFVDPSQTYDKNYAVNTIFSANLAANGQNPRSAAVLPSQNDSNPNDPTRPYIQNIGDLLDGAGVSWKWYSGGWDQAVLASGSNPNYPFNANPNAAPTLFQWHHQPLAYYDNFAPWNPDGTRNPLSAAHLQDENNFFSDVQSGTLPAVSFIKPLGPDNEHPGYTDLLRGQQHVADIVHAVQNSPEWAHTAVVITYDENGGRWDSVSPPTNNGIWGDGTRVPAIVISPFAKTGFVDHTEHDTLSILKTIEERFGLPPLSRYDAAASDLLSNFTLRTDVTGQVKLKTSDPDPDRKGGTFSVDVTVSNPEHAPGSHGQDSPTLQGAFGLLLSNLPQGVTFQSATVTVNGATVSLEFTHDSAGNPIVTLPKSIASSLEAGDSLPKITLTFAGQAPKHSDLDVEVFSDPFGA
jgi:3-phytase/alkaline phosphatase D